MRRFAPRSLFGQMALLLGLALLVAQVVNFGLILNERQKLSLVQNQGPAMTRFAGVAADVEQAAPEFRAAVIADNSHRGARFAVRASSAIADGRRSAASEARLAQALAAAGVDAREVRAGLDPDARPGDPARGRRWSADMQGLKLAVRRADGSWLTATMRVPRRDPWFAARLGAATLALYILVLGAGIWLARRLAAPLADLTAAARRFHGRSDPVPVVPRGPADLRVAIEAFNAMNGRVVALLDEKDRMLGAIGHDLRTPLASLRIRLESMEPEEEREAAIAKIEEMVAMLEDILVLARTGRAREQAQPVDVAALVDAIGEDYAALGRPVTVAPAARIVAAVQPNLVRRAVRNLIDNAVAHGGAARVAVGAAQDGLTISVTDDGPGIPAEEIARVLQPFYRREASRNRDSGGSGLGLAIVQSVAESHGGRLTLANRDPHGMIATIMLPIDGSDMLLPAARRN